MTERDTASLLRAALQRRAEYGMQTTNTDQELDRLRGQMTPVRRRRQLRAALATAAAVAVIGGGVGLGFALTSEDQGTTPPIATRPTPTMLPAGTLPAGFPIGKFSHPGGTGLSTLKITRHAVAWVIGTDGTGRNRLRFIAPDVVTFDVTNTVDCRTPGRYQWSVARNEMTLTTVSDSCSPRRIFLTEKPWGPIVKTQASAPVDFPVGSYARPGAATLTQLRLGDTKAVVRQGSNQLESLLSFPAPGQVRFDCYQDEVTPCLSKCLFDYNLSGRTLEFVRVHENSTCRSDDLMSSGSWQRSP